jgi:phosphoribosylglycinamide formyltransferase-1
MQRSLMVLVSGAGTTLENLCAKIWHKKINAYITCVIANHKRIDASRVSAKWGIPYWCLDTSVYPPKDKWDQTFDDLIRVYNPGLIVLAGFDRLLTIPPQYDKRVINTHPSLLPSFGGKGMYGDKVHEAVLQAGVKVSGCTIHLCNSEYDKGEILRQTEVEVKDDDTIESLRKRVQSAERACLPEVIDKYLDVLMAKNIY